MAHKFIAEHKARVVDLETGDVVAGLVDGRTGWVTVTSVDPHPKVIGVYVVSWSTPRVIRNDTPTGYAYEDAGQSPRKGIDLVTVQTEIDRFGRSVR